MRHASLQPHASLIDPPSIGPGLGPITTYHVHIIFGRITRLLFATHGSHYFAPDLPSAQGQKVKNLLVSPLEVMIFSFLLLLFFLWLWPHVANNVTDWISNMTLPYFPTFC
jgi:hypothetical protein